MESHRDDFAAGRLPLVLLQRREGDLGVAGVGAVDGFAVGPEGFLGEALGEPSVLARSGQA